MRFPRTGGGASNSKNADEVLGSGVTAADSAVAYNSDGDPGAELEPEPDGESGLDLWDATDPNDLGPNPNVALEPEPAGDAGP